MAPARQARRLMQVGASLILLAMIVGLVVSKFAVPRLGLSTHLLGLMQGLLLMVIGIVWPKLKLNAPLSLTAFVLAIYGCIAAWTANLLAAIWGAGASMLPLASGGARGSAVQELVIMVGLRSAAVSLILLMILILWGLRGNSAGHVDS